MSNPAEISPVSHKIENNNNTCINNNAGLWIGSDDYKTAHVCAEKVYDQLSSLKQITHPVSKKVLGVLRRTTADGKTRRSSTGSSSACSSFPITEAPEHTSQLGDMSFIFTEPVWTIQEAEKYHDLFPLWLKNRKDNQSNRREFAKTHFGNLGKTNITGTDLKHFYPPVMHRSLRSIETIGRKVGEIADIKYGSKAQWYNEMSKVARKSSHKNEQALTFSENGVVAFLENFSTFLKNACFAGLTFEVLSKFSSGLTKLYQWLLRTPVGLSGAEFDVHSRVLLGFQFVQIFGTDSITATIKQISVYTGYYIQQAKNDGSLTGLPISLRHFNDGIMETSHKLTKSGNLVFSGGRSGPMTSLEYQESILSQQMMNSIMRTHIHESIPTVSSNAKVKRKMTVTENEENTKKIKLGVIPFFNSNEGSCSSTSEKDDTIKEIQSRDNNEDEEDRHREESEYSCEESEDDQTLDSLIFSQVHDGDQAEIQTLKQQLLEHAESMYQSAPLNFINFETAESFSSTQCRWKSLKYHLNSTVICSTTNTEWKRKDSRVSIDLFQVSFNFIQNTITVSRTLPSNSEKNSTKITLPFKHIAGIVINDATDTVAAHIYRQPMITEKYSSGKWHTVEEPKVENSVGSISMHLVEGMYDFADLHECFQRNSYLIKPYKMGILHDKSYPPFNDNFEHEAYRLYPILRDPTLVCAVQLADLELLNHAKARQNDIKWLVKQYHGLNYMFRKLLEDRQLLREFHNPEE